MFPALAFSISINILHQCYWDVGARLKYAVLI